MPANKVAEFLESLARSRLLDQKQLDRLRSEIGKLAVEPTAPEIAKQLIRRKILTRWQAEQLLAGQTGFVLDEYQMLNPIGRGGMGHVFRARKTGTNEIVAVKVMARRHKQNESLVKRFRREIRASSRLSSPYIVKALDAGRSKNIDFLVMEYVDGEPLDDLTDRVGRLSAGEACEIARQAALGLQHAHECGMVHRDIKPANLILGWQENGEGILRIMDMGLVRMQTDDKQHGEDRAVTRAGQVMGTPDYMAPEQGWDTATVDIRSDIYSLGCTLFRMLTGTMPFRGDNPLQILMARCAKDAPPVRSIRPEIAQPISAVVQKMTLRDPDSRYQTPQEVADALAPFCRVPTRKWHAELPVDLDDLNGSPPTTPTSVSAGDRSDEDFRGDASYEQFLTAMNTSTDAGSLNTVIDTTPPVSTIKSLARQRSRSKPKLSRGAILTSAVVAAVGIIGLIAVLVLNGPASSRPDPDLTGPSDPDANNPVEAAETIEAAFEPIDAQTVTPGAPASVNLKWHARRNGEPVPTALKVEAPGLQGIRLDEESGQLIWDVPELQPPGDYSAYVTLSQAGGPDADELARVSVTFTIEREQVAMRVRQLPSRTAIAGEVLQVLALPRVMLQNLPGRSIRIDKSSETPDGVSLDLQTGMVNWTPGAKDVGDHEVVIRLVDAESDSARLEVRFAVHVTRQPIRFTAGSPEPQTIQAGRQFSFIPRLPNGDPIPDEIRLVPGPTSPPGTTVDPTTNEITWTPAPDLTGQFVIPVAVVSRTRGRALSVDSTRSLQLVVNVTAPTGFMLPEPEAIDAARQELRELMQRDFAQARSPLQRTALAEQLLERAVAQESGAAHYVMLDEAMVLARSARDLQTELKAAHRLHLEYGVEELGNVRESIDAFRTRDITAYQREAIVEHLLRIAGAALTKDDFETTALIMTKASLMFRPRGGDSAAALLAEDLQQAHQLADEISEAAASGNQPPPLRLSELARLLNRWQFEPLFQNEQARSYLRISNIPELSDQGRSRWTFDRNRIQLRSDPIAGVTGFVDQTLQPQRALVRFSIGPETTTGRLIFGGTQSEEGLDGVTLILGTDGFGQLSSLREGKRLAQPSRPVVRPEDRAADVSVLLDGNNVEVQIDGQVVMSTRLDVQTGGTLGLIAPLTPGGRIPVLDLRHARVLRLPAKAE